MEVYTSICPFVVNYANGLKIDPSTNPFGIHLSCETGSDVVGALRMSAIWIVNNIGSLTTPI